MAIGWAWQMSLQAFPDSKRLRTSTEFDLVFKNNQYRVSTPEFLFLAKENQVKMKRLGMVVAKRNTTRAVDRNCLKRLIREVFRCVELPSLDIVVLTRSRANGRSNSALTDILEQSFGSLSMQFTNHGKVHKWSLFSPNWSGSTRLRSVAYSVSDVVFTPAALNMLSKQLRSMALPGARCWRQQEYASVIPFTPEGLI